MCRYCGVPAAIFYSDITFIRDVLNFVLAQVPIQSLLNNFIVLFLFHKSTDVTGHRMSVGNPRSLRETKHIWRI